MSPPPSVRKQRANTPAPFFSLARAARGLCGFASREAVEASRQELT
jgi:hypothetical protein